MSPRTSSLAKAGSTFLMWPLKSLTLDHASFLKFSTPGFCDQSQWSLPICPSVPLQSPHGLSFIPTCWCLPGFCFSLLPVLFIFSNFTQWLKASQICTLSSDKSPELNLLLNITTWITPRHFNLFKINAVFMHVRRAPILSGLKTANQSQSLESGTFLISFFSLYVH